MVAKVLGKTRAPIKACVLMYKAVFQSVLLYGREIWVVMHTMMTVLELFHHRIAKRVAGLTERKGDGGE